MKNFIDMSAATNCDYEVERLIKASSLQTVLSSAWGYAYNKMLANGNRLSKNKKFVLNSCLDRLTNIIQDLDEVGITK